MIEFNIGYTMKQRFIQIFIITLETCIDALMLGAQYTYSTSFLGDNLRHPSSKVFMPHLLITFMIIGTRNVK